MARRILVCGLRENPENPPPRGLPQASWVLLDSPCAALLAPGGANNVSCPQAAWTLDLAYRLMGHGVDGRPRA